MDLNEYQKVVLERGVTFEKGTDGWLCLTSDEKQTFNDVDVNEAINYLGCRPILTSCVAGNSIVDLVIPFTAGRLLDVYRTELTTQTPINIQYLMGACLYQLKELVKWQSNYCIDYSNSVKPDVKIVVSSPETPHYIFEALVTEITRSFNALRYPIWSEWGGNGGTPNSFERTLIRLTTIPTEMKGFLEEKNILLNRVKEYRDCIQHYIDIGSSSWIQLEKLQDFTWSVIARIPDNPESRSRKMFKFNSNLDAVSMAWKFTTEYFETVAVLFGRQELASRTIAANQGLHWTAAKNAAPSEP